MRNWLKTVLFLSAFSPVLITLAYVGYIENAVTPNVISLLIAGFLGSILPILILVSVEKGSEKIVFKANKVEANDFMLLAFVGSYLFPIVAKASALTMEVTVMLIFCIAVILWAVGSIPAHPILRLLKFRFYKVEASTGMVYTLISRREIRDPKNITSVKRISNSMLVEVP